MSATKEFAYGEQGEMFPLIENFGIDRARVMNMTATLHGLISVYDKHGIVEICGDMLCSLAAMATKIAWIARLEHCDVKELWDEWTVYFEEYVSSDWCCHQISVVDVEDTLHNFFLKKVYQEEEWDDRWD